MIKSKIDARERALELVIPAAVKLMEGGATVDLVKLADEVKDYIIGDAKLPEVTDDNAHIKELLEIANKSFDNSQKFSNEGYDCIFKGGNADVPSEMPCKSDVE